MTNGICDTGAPKAVAREYQRDMLLAGGGYLVAVFVSVYVVKHFAPPQWAAVLLALAPMAPVAGMLRAYLRLLNRLDEFQRRVQLESMLIAVGIVGFGSLTYGFLESFAGFPAIPDVMLWISPTLWIVWGMAQVFVRRRYR